MWVIHSSLSICHKQYNLILSNLKILSISNLSCNFFFILLINSCILVPWSPGFEYVHSTPSLSYMGRFFGRETEAPYHSRSGTIKIPPCIKAIRPEQITKFSSPSSWINLKTLNNLQSINQCCTLDEFCEFHLITYAGFHFGQFPFTMLAVRWQIISIIECFI